MNKPFSKELHERNDPAAKKIACDFCLFFGYKFEIPIEEQEERYKDWDFEVIDKNKKRTRIEVERKEVWDVSFKWQSKYWKTLDVPFRKAESKADIFIMTNKHLNTLAVIKMSDVLNSNIITKDTIYTKNEKFFAVNLNMVKFYGKEENEWRKINGKY